MNETAPMTPVYPACENEPIHAPGAIQPFGVLLAFDATTFVVRHASENSRDLFGSISNATVPLGSTAAELLGPVAEAALRDALAKDGLVEHRPILVTVPGPEANRWHAVAHRLDDMVFVELEADDEETSSPIDLLAAIRLSVGQLSAAASVAEFCARAARAVRSLTGYDRVMVYRFDAEHNGEVVAEQGREDLEPFLGLHNPASDIPAQSRALFLVNRIRVIPDAAAEPILLVADGDGPRAGPLDLSRCLLRSAARRPSTGSTCTTWG